MNNGVKAHHKKQLKRSKQYRKLLGINLPDRAKDKKKVVGNLWYIVWEKNLLKPKLFKYSFVTDYFAISFANKWLKDKPFYVVKGSDLKVFGILRVNIRLSYAHKHNQSTLPYKYDFPEGLSLQRKKTLRTMYRRNLRRLLLKLLKKKNKKMADTFIKKKIDEKPGAFFKKLRYQWFYDLTYSVTFRDWYVREESWRIEEISKAGNYYPNDVSQIANILIILETKYSDDIYDYKNENFVSMAIHIWKTYKERIERYMRKKGYIPKLGSANIQEAFKELVERGFVPEVLLITRFNKKKDLYIGCFSGGIDLVFPKKAKDEQEMVLLQQRFGVRGYTGCNYINK